VYKATSLEELHLPMETSDRDPTVLAQGGKEWKAGAVGPGMIGQEDKDELRASVAHLLASGPIDQLV
jgi:hypothetical protein